MTVTCGLACRWHEAVAYEGWRQERWPMVWLVVQADARTLATTPVPPPGEGAPLPLLCTLAAGWSFCRCGGDSRADLAPVLASTGTKLSQRLLVTPCLAPPCCRQNATDGFI